MGRCAWAGKGGGGGFQGEAERVAGASGGVGTGSVGGLYQGGQGSGVARHLGLVKSENDSIVRHTRAASFWRGKAEWQGFGGGLAFLARTW